jgi:hypothetical protein
MDLYDVMRTTHAVLPSGKSFLGFRIDREAGEDHQIEADRAAERVSHLRHPPTDDGFEVRYVPEDGAEHRGAARAGVGGAARGHVGKSVRIPVSLAERSHSSRASVTGCPGLLVDLRVAADAPEAVRSDVAGARHVLWRLVYGTGITAFPVHSWRCGVASPGMSWELPPWVEPTGRHHRHCRRKPQPVRRGRSRLAAERSCP